MEYDACKGSGDREERMVKSELEAAEVLAGLAHSSIPQEEEPAHPPIQQHPHPLKHRSSSPNRVILIQEQESEMACNVITTESIEGEKNIDVKPGLLCSTANYHSVTSSKSRQSLTETEKEARKLRRVLANRESARQTIRRRQAMFEELTRKAADLALENENLKKEKELAVKEYDSLKNTNDCLKEQMAEMVKPKAEEILGELNPNHAETSASASLRTPFSPYNQPPAVPLHWSSIIQPPMLCDIADSSLFRMTHSWRPELFSDPRNSTMIANPGAVLYVLPFPCFFPMHSPTNVLQPQPSHRNDGQNQMHPNIQCTASSSSRSTNHGEDYQPSLSLKVKVDASDSTLSITADDLHQAGSGFPPDVGGDNSERTYIDRTILTPTPLSCVRPSISIDAGLNTTSQQDNIYNVETIASSAWQSEKNASGEPVAHSRKKPVDASSAAKARKRRKELMKLKIPQVSH